MKTIFRQFLILFVLSLIPGNLFSAATPFQFIPDDVRLLIAIDVPPMIDGISSFFTEKNPVFKDIQTEILATVKSMGKSIPPQLEKSLDLKKMEKKIQQFYKDAKGITPERILMFIRPKSRLKGTKDALYVVVEGEISIEKLQAYTKKESPEVTFKKIKQNSFNIIELGNLQKAVEARRQAEMKKLGPAAKKVKIKTKDIPDVLWAVDFGKSYLMAPKSLISDILKTGAKRSVFARLPFTQQAVKLIETGNFFSFSGQAPAKDKRMNGFKGSLSMASFNLDAQLKEKADAKVKKSIAEAKMKIQQAMGFVKMMGPQMAKGSPVVKKGVDYLAGFLESVKLTLKDDSISFSVSNPGLTGLAYIITGVAKAALPMIMGKFNRSSGRKKVMPRPGK